jgi:hypothetical protein
MVKNRLGLRTAVLALLLCAPACRTSVSLGNGVQGDGVAKSETREIPAFDSIEVDGTVKLDFATGPLDKLSITGDENLLPLISTTVTGTKLVVHETKAVHSKTPLVVSVHSPTLTRIDAAGISGVIATGLHGASFTYTSSGVSNAELTGQVDSLEVQAGGTGEVHAAGLTAKQAHVAISGAGTVEVNATDKLKADVSGVGSVKYRGSPTVEKDVSGMGTVGPLG